MKIVNTIKVLEIDNEQLPASQKTDLYVKSHWDETSNLIILDIKGIQYSVNLQELLTAVINVKRSSI